jgi:hypothetical protein
MIQQTPQDEYVEAVVRRRPATAVAPGSLDPLLTIVRNWANAYLLEFKLSGSYVKGTAVGGSSDIDLLVSLRNDVLCGRTPTLSSLYQSLNAWLVNAGYLTRLQNVSIGLKQGVLSVDLVPAVKHTGNTNDHSLYKRKADSWTKTNIDTHINVVRNSGRILDIKALKIWRNLHRLEISSFYLELAVLEALKGKALYAPAANFFHVLDFLGSQFEHRNFVDPANTANLISDELSASEKPAIANQARKSRQMPNWGTIIW